MNLRAGTPEHRPLDTVLEIGWLLTAALVPLLVNLWGRQPFELPKAALLRSLVWVMVAVWLADLLLARRPSWRGLLRNPLLWPALALALVLALATGPAADRNLSLWGSYERAQGVATLLSYILLFLLVADRLRTPEQARRLVWMMVATALPLVILGLAQSFGWDSFGLTTDARSPVFATLGRSTFLGAYLAMLLPLTLALNLSEKRLWRRLAIVGLVLGEIGVIILTRSRGALLAALVALLVFGLLWFWPRLSRRWRLILAALLLTGLGAGLVGAFWLERQAGSAAARLTIWQTSFELIAKRPWLGYGPDSLGLIFPHVYPPQLVYYQGRGVVVDRAHNLLLDWALTAGIAGLLANLALLVGFFAVGWRAVRQVHDLRQRGLILACLAAVCANLAGNLVSFDVTATATAFWLLMALTVALARLNNPTAPSPKHFYNAKRTPAERINRPWWRWTAAGLLLAVAGVAVVQANLRPLAADILARTSDQRVSRADWPSAITAGQQAVVLWPYEPAHRLALSWMYLNMAQSGVGDPFPWLRRAETELQAARDLRSEDYVTWSSLGELYGIWGNRWDAGKLALADDAYRHATALAPHHAILYTAWGIIALENGQPDLAAVKFRQAVDLDATDGYAFCRLGEAELAQGHVEAALAAFREAVHWEPGLIYAHLGLARCYWRSGQPAAAKLALERALQLDPTNRTALALRQELNSEQ